MPLINSKQLDYFCPFQSNIYLILYTGPTAYLHLERKLLIAHLDECSVLCSIQEIHPNH